MIITKLSGHGDEVSVEEIQENIGLIQRYLRELPDKALNLGIRVLLALVFCFIGVQIIKLMRKIVCRSLKRTNADVGVIQFLDSFMKMALYVVLGFMIISSLGVDAASIVAVLGSAGVAIGLALQGSLSNLAGGVLILLLKPFKVGDYIIEDSNGHEGTVTDIELFFTKLTTFDGKIVVLPNGTLANTSLTNVSAALHRRLDFQIGISYDSDAALAKECLLTILSEDENTLKNMEILTFIEALEPSAVMIGGRCYVNGDDYFTVKWRVTEKIKDSFAKNKIRIPYPQLDIHLENQEKYNNEIKED